MLYVSRLGCTGLFLSDSAHSLLSLKKKKKKDGHQDAEINSSRSVIDETRLVCTHDEIHLTTCSKLQSFVVWLLKNAVLENRKLYPWRSIHQ